VIPIHLEVGKNLRLCILDQLLLVFLKLMLIFSRQSLHSCWERCWNYPFNRPLRVDLIDLHVKSPAESPKSVLVLIWAPIITRCTDGGALRDSTNGPRLRVGRSATCGRSWSSLRRSRTVHACTGAAAFANSTWILLPRGTPSGRRDP
jgi:hypothetical protein